MEIVLHLGAHKTATTFIQSLLHKNVVALEQHNVGFESPKTLRPMFAIAPRGNFPAPRAQRIAARTWALTQVINTAVDLRRRRLVISEEQLIGSLRALMSGRGLYRDVKNELRAVRKALQGHPVRVMLALRSYDSFFISAYGQVLNGWKYLPFDRKRRDRLLSDRRSWPDVIADIMLALPEGSTLKVWRYEDFSQIQSSVFSALIGEEAARHLQKQNGTPVPGPSQDAIAAIEAQVAETGSIESEQIRKILRAFGKDKGFAAFQPWSEEEETILTDRYRQDIALVRDMWPGALIEHPVGEASGVPGTQTGQGANQQSSTLPPPPDVTAPQPEPSNSRPVTRATSAPRFQSGVSMYPAPRTV